jgi:peroxiredoxin Q/BCP
MTPLEAGMRAPDFSAPAMQGGEEIESLGLSNFQGKKLVIFFYPKDDTPGCTKESCAFRDEKAEFAAVGAEVIGISKDPIKKHGKFIGKYDLNFPLISDENTSICEDYGV